MQLEAVYLEALLYPNIYTVPDGTQVCVQINNAKCSIQYLTIDHLQYLISGDA